ncbi:MAG: DUF6624 domain-containing protein [Phycisphaerales bacterium]
MQSILKLIFVSLFIFSGCHSSVSRDTDHAADRLEEIAGELIELAKDDQRWEQMVIQGEVPASSKERREFFAEKSRLMVVRGARCEAIFEEFGFPDYQMVGKEAGEAFWLIVQHSDHNPEFQENVVEAMKYAVMRGQADGTNLAYLTDRVLINTGRAQEYGTQLEYEHANARAYPKELTKSAMVDERRARVGLEPLGEYMNSMSELFFMMNEEQLRENGVEGAYVYPEGFDDW